MIHFPLNSVTLSSRCKDLILRHAKVTTFSDNRIIYLQEDLADRFYIVMSGYVRLSYILENGTAILYGIVPPGQSFGELSVFDNSAHTDTASAVGSVSLLSVRADFIHAECARNEEMRTLLSGLVASRYRSYIDTTKGLYLNNLSARLAMALLRLAYSFQQATMVGEQKCLYLGPIVTQTDLGAMARGTRGNVNRLLKRWERDHLILLRDRQIILLDPEGLELLTQGSGDDA